MSRTPTHELVRLLEQAMVEAVRLRSPDGAREVQTLDLNINVMHTARGDLRALAQVMGGGKTMCFCEGQVLDAQGQVVAQGMGTLRQG